MLGKEAVALADAWRPNGIGAEDKARWLSQIDGRLLKELYALYDGEEKEMPLYTPEGEEELLAPPPYDEIYVYGDGLDEFGKPKGIGRIFKNRLLENLKKESQSTVKMYFNAMFEKICGNDCKNPFDDEPQQLKMNLGDKK